MIDLLPTDPDADAAELIERLRKSAEYLGLVAAQLEAIRAGDPEEVRRLDVEKTALEREWAAADDDGTEPAGPPPPDLAAILALGREQLDSYFQAQRHAEETWSRLTDGTAKSARAVPVPRLPRTRYPELATGELRVDVRL